MFKHIQTFIENCLQNDKQSLKLICVLHNDITRTLYRQYFHQSQIVLDLTLYFCVTHFMNNIQCSFMMNF